MEEMAHTELSFTAILVLITFVIVLAILVSEKIDKTALALIGTSVVSVILFLFPTDSIHGVPVTPNLIVAELPWDTIMFIFFMMLIVATAARSGLFQWLAVVTIQVTKAQPKTLYFAFVLLTFFISFFFDTVTSLLIMAPLTIEIMKVLNRDFRPYLISEALVANFGSTPSFIGAVPNIVIGKVAKLTFIQFLVVLGPLAIITLLTSIPFFLYFHKDVLENRQNPEDMDMRIFMLDATLVIKRPRLFLTSILGILILIFGFTVGQVIGMSPILTAMCAMTFLLIATRDQIPETLKEVQWSTVFFLVGLLAIIQAIEELGVIEITAEVLQPIVSNSPELAGLLMLWVGGVLSGVVDNIPISAALAPVAYKLGGEGSLLALALAYGVNIGGYLSPIASPANILALAYSEKEHNPISFIEFAKLGTTLAIVHLIIGSFYFFFLGPLFGGIVKV